MGPTNAQEIMSYLNSNMVKAYAVSLDESKAFDGVNYINMFEKLLRKEMCPQVMGILL